MNTSSPLLVNLDITFDANGKCTAIAVQPDSTKGSVYACVNAENASANANYTAQVAKNPKAAALAFERQALLSARDALNRALLSDSDKAAALSAAQATVDTVVVDQVP